MAIGTFDLPLHRDFCQKVGYINWRALFENIDMYESAVIARQNFGQEDNFREPLWSCKLIKEFSIFLPHLIIKLSTIGPAF